MPALLLSLVLALQGPPAEPPTHGERPARLLIRNAMVVRGNGTPAFGPTNLLVEDGLIIEIGRTVGERAGAQAAKVIDGTGKYVLPGFISSHTHIQSERGSVPLDPQFQFNLWLACGMTTIRDTGSLLRTTVGFRKSSAAGELVAPRIFAYTVSGSGKDAEEVRRKVRAAKAGGADGLKLFGADRDLLAALLDEAKAQELPTTIHIGVEEVTAWDLCELGVDCIEHWYGVPDAALRQGVQWFPAAYNYGNEVDRFRHAGRLWRETDPDKLEDVLRFMVERGVAWSPTFAIYEACREVRAAKHRPWMEDFLHPALEEFFKPSLENHGSFFIGWTNTDEVFWKENYRLWMAAVKRFAELGGTVLTGEDAGFIYQVYGFCFLRELEMQEEAGFHPLQVIEHATGNGAKVLGQADRLGRVRPGYVADLLVVNGNPLENLRVLYPTGTDSYRDGKVVHGGGIEWTIKDGRTYHVPVLVDEARKLVAEARAKRK
jgi:imidazolonepropionase-like amidohydrolase